MARTLVCNCSSPPIWPQAGRQTCPAYLMADQLLLLRAYFTDRHDSNGVPDWELPLFPAITGEVTSKEAMVATIVKAGEMLGVARESPDGSERLSGHSLRVTGAQGLAVLGWHLWAIQLQGRWGSDTTNKYLREAPLVHHSTTPVSAVDVDALIEKILPLLQQPDRQPRPAPTPSPAQSEHVERLLDQQASLTIRSSPSSSASSERALTPTDLVVNLNSGFTHTER